MSDFAALIQELENDFGTLKNEIDTEAYAEARASIQNLQISLEELESAVQEAEEEEVFVEAEVEPDEDQDQDEDGDEGEEDEVFDEEYFEEEYD